MSVIGAVPLGATPSSGADAPAGRSVGRPVTLSHLSPMSLPRLWSWSACRPPLALPPGSHLPGPSPPLKFQMATPARPSTSSQLSGSPRSRSPLLASQSRGAAHPGQAAAPTPPRTHPLSSSPPPPPPPIPPSPAAAPPPRNPSPPCFSSFSPSLIHPSPSSSLRSSTI